MFSTIPKGLQNALILFLVVLVVTTLTVFSSYWYLDDLEQDERKARRSMQTWKSKIVTAKENNQLIVEYEKPYLELIENSILGDENRLSWYESLQSTAASRGLESFRYSVDSQQQVKSSNVAPEYSGLDIYRSIMKISMEVSHEGDIFAAFNDLDSKAKGLYTVDKCALDFKINTGNDGSEKPQVSANCELSWYTMKSK